MIKHSRILNVILLFLIGMYGIGLGQQSQLGKILGLSVSGNVTSDASVIKLSSGLREGENVSWEDIQRAVKQLWALGIFSDIQILLDKKMPEGVFMTIKVKEYPRLERIVIEGNKKIKKDEIEIKICRRRAMPLSGKQDLDQIRKALEDNTIEKSPNRGNMARKDILQEFIDHCFGLVDIYSIKPLKLIIEAHGGTANNFIPSILERLPVKTGPVLNSDMSANDIKVSGRADLGVEFDRAGGRITLYDSKGKSVAGDILTALVADYLLEKYPGETILYSLICSKAVPELIARKGGQALKTRVGPSLIRPMMKKHNALFGGEPSGYYYYRDNWFADSSIITFLIILEIISRSDRPLEQIVKDIDHYFRSGEITVRANSAREKMETIAEKYASGIQDRLDGLSVEMDDFWFNIRLSNTEPAVRLNVEAISKELLDEKIEEILDLINS